MNLFRPFPWQVAPFRDKSPVMLLSGSAGGGKALDISIPILTMNGWKTMGSISVGDIVFDELGNLCSVVAISEAMDERPCFELTFSSGEKIVADALHQWHTYNPKERYAWSKNLERAVNPERGYGQVRTTKEILQTLNYRETHANHSVRVAPALNIPKNEPLFIPPYVLGAWLGDGNHQSGHITCHNDDYEIIENIKRYGYDEEFMGIYSHAIVGLGFQLSEMGLLYNKHIPEQYFTACYEDRLALLQGLLDTDGSVTVQGRVEITQVRENLIVDIQRLLSTLGIRASTNSTEAGYTGYKVNGMAYRVQTGLRHRISFYTDLPVFRLKRKLERCVAETTERTRWRYIKDVREVESVPVRCIQVDSPSGEFLVGNTLIPTHNSNLAGSKLDAFLRHYPGATGVASRKVFEDAKPSIIPFLTETVIDYENDPNVTFYKRDSRVIYHHQGAPDSELLMIGMKATKAATGIRSIGKKGDVDIWWMEEATEYEERDFSEVTGRMRGKAASWTQIILTTNPGPRNHWINLRLILGNNPDVAVYLSSAEDNPSSPESYKRGLKNMTGVEGKRLGQGLWVDGEGQVIDTWKDNFNASRNVGTGNVTPAAEYMPYNGKLGWYVDDGYSGEFNEEAGLFTAKSQPRAFLIVQERADGTIAIVGEHLAVKKLQDDHIAEVLAYHKRMGWPKPSFAVHDGASPSLGGALMRAGVTAIPVRCKIDQGVEELRNWIGPDRNKVRRVIVHPRCFFLRYEMGAYTYDPNGTPLDMNNHTIDACLVAGTMVTTEQGAMPIEQIVADNLSRGVKVLTRKGYRPVLHAWMTNPEAKTYTVELSDGNKLIGTGNHPVFLGDKFVPLVTLSPGDVLQSVTKYINEGEGQCFTKSLLAPKQSRLLNTRGLNLDAILNRPTMPKEVTTDQIFMWRSLVLKLFIERFTKTITDLFRRVITSTTKTRTLSIIPQTISRLCHRQNTRVFTIPKSLSECLNILKQLDRLRLNGMVLQRVGSGTANMPLSYGRIERSKNTPANGVRPRSLARKALMSASVPTLAKQQREEPLVLITKSGLANGAGQPSLSTSTKVPQPVPVHVLRVYENITREPVYNLEVAEENEYFASDVLVHNCRYGVWHKAHGAAGSVSLAALSSSDTIDTYDIANRVAMQVDAAYAAALAKIEPEIEKWRNKMVQP